MNPDALGALSPRGRWRGKGVNSQPKSHPTFGMLPLRMRNFSDQILARSGPRMRRFSGRYRGGAPNLGGSYPAALWETPFHLQLSSSIIKGEQFQHFLRGDGSSRRAKAGFREVRLLPGLRTKGLAIISGSPRLRK